MFNKKEILIWIVVFIVGVFMAWSCRLEAMDIQKLEEPIQKEEGKELYPNFLLYNSTQSCMRGIVQMIIQINPQLRNQMIPPAIQQQILGHCSCVVDKIRLKYPIQEYYKKMGDFLWIRDVWGGYGTECMKAGYLAGVIPDDLPEKLEKIQTDNKTKENTKVEDNKTKSLEPKSKEEEILIKEPEPAIFQG